MKEQCTECGEYLIKTTGSTYCPNAGKHQHKKPQMMICPDWETCTEICSAKVKHKRERACLGHKNHKVMCPACIEYAEPSPKGYPAKCTLFGGDKGKCRTECKKCWKDTRPEPMPLIDVEWLKVKTWRCPKCNQLSDIDLTAHDQQVRKDLIEEIISKLPVWRLRLPLSEDVSKIIEAHIRAMAELKKQLREG
jgi:hypothetical protein